MKCSTRNAPTGTMPLREWSRRQKNKSPCPARIGGTPRAIGVITLDTSDPILDRVDCNGKPFIMEPRSNRVKPQLNKERSIWNIGTSILPTSHNTPPSDQ